MAAQYAYVMKGMTKTFPGGKQVLKDIWLSFLPGAKIGVVGPNGAGKSSLLKIMAGIDDVSNGEAKLLEGYTVGILMQEPNLDESKTVLENVEEAVAPIRRLLARQAGFDRRSRGRELGREVDPVPRPPHIYAVLGGRPPDR